ncbi:uncharacterized protein LOC144463846 [Epinephelus lanceolatus]
MAVQTWLANTGAILSLYLRDLSRQVQDDTSVGEELQTASSCLSSVMKEQAGAAGSALASFWVVRRHLWLSQSQLQQGDRDCLLKVPLEPTAMFGPHATALVQQAQESHRCVKEEISDSSWRLPGGVGTADRAEGEDHLLQPWGPPSAPRPPDNYQALANLSPPPASHETAWLALGADPWVVSTMTHGYRIQLSCRPPVTRKPTFTTVSDPQRRLVLEAELSTLLEKAAIREVASGDHQVGFFSRYFLTPKKDGGLCPILDLRGLNRYLQPLRYRFLTVPRVRQAVTAEDWFATIDLKDAYFQIPIWRGHWRFLCFGFAGRVYEFQMLPFGISLAPRTFSRCMDAALSPLRQRGIRILNYLDDWLVCAVSEEQCHHHVALLLEHVQRLGLRLNYKKSRLQPSQVMTFLGMVLDSRRATVTLTLERQPALRTCLALFQLHARVNWGLCLRLMGLMAATVQVVPLALLHMWPVQRCLLVTEMPAGLGALQWWKVPANIAVGRGLGPVVYRQLVYTDASSSGWDAVHEGRGINGVWTGRWLCQHINVLEVRAVLLTLHHFLLRVRGHHIIVRTDSTVTAAYINRQGGLGVQGVDTLPALLLPEERLSPLRVGCSGSSMAPGSALRLSSLHSSPPSSPKSSGGAGAAYIGGTYVAPHAVVLGDSASAGRAAMGAPAPEGPALPGERSPVPPLSSGAQAGGLAPERERLLALGLPEPVVATMQHARAPSMRAAYSHRWQVFTNWCESQQVDPYLAPAQEILRFLQSQLEAQKAAVTLRGLVTAIKAVRIDEFALSAEDYVLIFRFLRGAQRLTVHTTGPVVPPWDLDVVLGALKHSPFESLGGADLKWLSMKTAFLLAVTSARRVSKVHALSVHGNCCRFSPDGSSVVLRPNPAFLSKVLTEFHLSQSVELKSLSSPSAGEEVEQGQSALCPVRALTEYIRRTQAVRRDPGTFHSECGCLMGLVVGGLPCFHMLRHHMVIPVDLYQVLAFEHGRQPLVWGAGAGRGPTVDIFVSPSALCLAG